MTRSKNARESLARLDHPASPERRDSREAKGKKVHPATRAIKGRKARKDSSVPPAIRDQPEPPEYPERMASLDQTVNLAGRVNQVTTEPKVLEVTKDQTGTRDPPVRKATRASKVKAGHPAQSVRPETGVTRVTKDLRVIKAKREDSGLAVPRATKDPKGTMEKMAKKVHKGHKVYKGTWVFPVMLAHQASQERRENLVTRANWVRSVHQEALVTKATRATKGAWDRKERHQVPVSLASLVILVLKVILGGTATTITKLITQTNSGMVFLTFKDIPKSVPQLQMAIH